MDGLGEGGHEDVFLEMGELVKVDRVLQSDAIEESAPISECASSLGFCGRHRSGCTGNSSSVDETKEDISAGTGIILKFCGSCEWTV